MASRNSATYWVKAIKQLESAIRDCQSQNKGDYQKALIRATRELRTIRQRAGIRC